jgi:hypothetical protein
MANSGNAQAMMAWFEAKVRNLDRGMREAAKESGDEIADLTRMHIETRGIKKPGRIDTGAMLESVDSEVTRETPTEIEVRAGYFETLFYVPYQELGTSTIAPTYALTDAAEIVLPKLKKRIEEAGRDA